MQRNSRETTAGASKRNGIRAKPQRERRNQGSVSAARRETTAGASKPRTRPTARAVAVGNLSGPPRRGLKRPREAGIRAKPQGEHRNTTEFARNHSGSIEMQRNSRETTAGASKRNGTRAKPQREHRNQGPVPPRAVAVGNLSSPPRRGLKRPREAGIRAKPQREHRNATEFARNHSGSIETQRNSCETTAGASKPRLRLSGAPRNHSGSIETKDPSHRTRRCGRQPKWPPQKRPEEATRGRNSRETTGGASKHNGIRAKPQRERRNQGPVPPPRAPLRSATNSFTLKEKKEK